MKSKSGDAALLYVPKSHVPGEAIDLVYYLHGRTGTYDSIDDRARLRDGLLEAGYVVACPHLHGDQWGNRLAQDDLATLDAWISERWSLGKRFLVGESMGGTTAANMVRVRELTVAAAVLIAPSLSMRAAWNRNDEARASLIDAFGLLPNGSDLESKTAEWDAVRHDPAVYAGLHALVFASPDDPAAHLATVTKPWLEAARHTAAQLRLIEVSGDHVSDDHFRPSDVVAFFDSF